MKKIEAIIRPEKVAQVCELLEKVGYSGMMITELEGHGNQKGIEQKVRGKSYKIKMMLKVRLEVIVDDNVVNSIAEAICKAARTGLQGDGKIFIYPIEDAIRIRTGEHGKIAL